MSSVETMSEEEKEKQRQTNTDASNNRLMITGIIVGVLVC